MKQGDKLRAIVLSRRKMILARTGTVVLNLAISGDIFDCHNWEGAPGIPVGRGRGYC